MTSTNTIKRRQSSSYSDDLSRYEFIDYTSVSNFEKFITHIEETLLSWGVQNGSFGVFSKQQLSSAKAAISHPSGLEFTRKETLTMGEEVFQITYHAHPLIHNSSSQFPLAADEFYKFSSSNNGHSQPYHPLHRWTGQGRLFIIKPIRGSIKSRLFNTGNKATVDLMGAKQLVSACAIAFQNTGCKVPVFVPLGQSKYDMYMGYRMISGDEDSGACNPLNETEVRFNMSVLTPPNAQLSHLDGLKALFLQKLSIQCEEYGMSGEQERNVWVSAVYTYNLKNWFDENWKDWEDIIEQEECVMKRKSSFSSDFESWGDEYDDVDSKGSVQDDQEQQQDKDCKRSVEDFLPFGSFNDPLRTLTLSAIFPLSRDSLFDDTYQTNMDALTAKQWQLSREFAPSNQQRAYLSTLLEQVVDSWIKDPTNKEYLAPYDDSNDDSISDSIGLMRNIFTTGINYQQQLTSSTNTTSSSNSSEGQVTLVKSDQVENVMTALFHSKADKVLSEQEQAAISSKWRTYNAVLPVYNTKKLGMRLKRGSPVPYQSFLWNLLVHSLEATIAKNSDENNSKAIPNFIGFLRVIWLQVLRQIRWHWENLVPIPDLNPYLYDTAEKSDESNNKNYTTLGIDLRYNILHQKISMVNCCIHRKLQNVPQNGDISLVEQQLQQPRFQTLIDRLAEGNDGNNTFASNNHGSRNAEEPSDIPDDVSNDSDVFLDAVEAEAEEDAASISSSCTATSTKTKMSNINNRSTAEEGEEVIVSNNPMAESFVSLPYIAQAITDNEAHVIKDPNASEGQLYAHKILRLLETNEPMQIPITQDPGFMTEDMIAEQADVFEKLGTSENATQLRAKLQSAQLYSDMEAFKAANPYACLEDFVRWHSPRDWIENKDGQSGALSTRMSESSNIWQELWKCSRRVPCSKQKPLFNMSVEAEKALYFLETTSIHEFFSIMLPTVSLIAYDTLSNHPIVQYSQQVSNELSRLGTELTEFPWDDLRHGKRTFDSILFSIRQQESLMCHAISLLRKLPRQYDLVDKLLVCDQTLVQEGEERESVFQLFKNNQGVISQPSCREYMMYSDCKYLTSNDRILPQRQYAIVKDSEIRIVDMQTTDALYA